MKVYLKGCVSMYLKEELIKKINDERSLIEFYHLKPEILKHLEEKIPKKGEDK